MRMDIEVMLGNISKKSGEKIETLRTEYQSILEKTAPGKNREMKALRELNKMFNVGRSNAVSFEGIIIGIGKQVDFNRNRITVALNAYQQNAEDAIQRNLVTVKDGVAIALDDRETYADGSKNNNFGKELKPALNRSCVAIIKTDGSYKTAYLNLRNRHASGDLPPVNTLLKFRALGDLEKGLRTSDSATNFEVVSVLSGADLTTIISDHCENDVKMLGDCLDYHHSLPPKTPEYYNRYVITMGTVSFSKENEDPEKSNFLILDDPTVEDGVSCFIPKHIPLPQSGEEISVVAQTVSGKGWDSEKKVQTEEEVLNLNILGVIPS